MVNIISFMTAKTFSGGVLLTVVPDLTISIRQPWSAKGMILSCFNEEGDYCHRMIWSLLKRAPEFLLIADS